MVLETLSTRDIIFCHFESFFALSLPSRPRKSKFWKIEKIFGDIIIVHMCTLNYNHMMYSSWDMECDRIFCNFRLIFALLLLYWPRKSKFRKPENNTWRYYHFTYVYHKWQSYDIWFLRYGVRQTEFFCFWTIFCPFTPLTTQKIKILQKWKKTTGDMIILHMCTINNNHVMNGS